MLNQKSYTKIYTKTEIYKILNGANCFGGFQAISEKIVGSFMKGYHGRRIHVVHFMCASTHPHQL